MAIVRTEIFFPGSKFGQHISWLRIIEPNKELRYKRARLDYGENKFKGEVRVSRISPETVNIQVKGGNTNQVIFSAQLSGRELCPPEGGIKIIRGLGNCRQTNIEYMWASDADRAEKENYLRRKE